MMRTPISAIARGATAALLMLAAAGCEAPQPLAPTTSVADYIPRVSTANGAIAAVLREGVAPLSAGTGAPVVPATGNAVNGGSAQVPVSASGDFTTIIIAIQGSNDYWELTLPAGVSASDVILGVAASVRATTLRVRYSVGSATAVGEYATQNLRVHRVGNGDIQISVSWTGASDVDLHVIDPSGAEVSWSNTTVASGGTLDLDSNAGCAIDNVNNENIVWAVGAAPRGEYRVVVDYWSDCGVPQSDYVVTVQAAGLTPQVFSGSFVGVSSGNPDAAIATFTY